MPFKLNLQVRSNCILILVLSKFYVQIQCKELNKLDHTAISPKESYSVEVRDTYLPPWITYNLCTLMASNAREFEARFAFTLFTADVHCMLPLNSFINASNCRFAALPLSLLQQGWTLRYRSWKMNLKKLKQMTVQHSKFQVLLSPQKCVLQY